MRKPEGGDYWELRPGSRSKQSHSHVSSPVRREPPRVQPCWILHSPEAQQWERESLDRDCAGSEAESLVLGGSFQKADCSSVRGRAFSSKTKGGFTLVVSRTQWGCLSGRQRDESPRLPGGPGWVSPTVREESHCLTCTCVRLGWGVRGLPPGWEVSATRSPGSAVTGDPTPPACQRSPPGQPLPLPTLILCRFGGELPGTLTKGPLDRCLLETSPLTLLALWIVTRHAPLGEQAVARA